MEDIEENTHCSKLRVCNAAAFLSPFRQLGMELGKKNNVEIEYYL
jgi:hypothetical protein